MYVTRISPNGSQEFAKTYGNTSGEDYRTGRAITRTTDGNYVIAGASNHLYNRYTSNFTYLAKVGPDGSLLWDRYCDLGLPGTFGADVVETGDGGLAVVGTAWLPAGSGSYTTGTSGYTINYDALLVKRDKDGRIEWARTYDGVYRDGNSKNDGNALRETIDGGFLLKLRAEKLTPTIIATPIPSGTGCPVTTAPSGQSSSGGLCGGMAILPLLLIGSAGVAAARLHKDRVRQ